MKRRDSEVCPEEKEQGPGTGRRWGARSRERYRATKKLRRMRQQLEQATGALRTAGMKIRDAHSELARAQAKAECLEQEKEQLQLQVEDLHTLIQAMAPMLSEATVLDAPRCAHKLPDNKFASMRKGHLNNFTEITVDTVAFCEGAFAVMALFNVPLDRRDAQRYLAFMRRVVKVMNPLQRHTICTGGRTVGIGFTHKYKKGSPIKEYLVCEWYRLGDKTTLDDVAPELHATGVELVSQLSQWLGQCFPPALLERIRVAHHFRLPTVGESSTTVGFITQNFLSAAHVNCDDGNACAVALAFEDHEPHCRRMDSCRSNWVFFVAELCIFIRLQHGLFFVFDSEKFPHGTACNDEPVPGGC